MARSRLVRLVGVGSAALVEKPLLAVDNLYLLDLYRTLLWQSSAITSSNMQSMMVNKYLTF
jgi:hypothetical protein